MEKDENKDLLIKILDLIDLLNDMDAKGCDVHIRHHEDALYFKCEYEIES